MNRTRRNRVIVCKKDDTYADAFLGDRGQIKGITREELYRSVAEIISYAWMSIPIGILHGAI